MSYFTAASNRFQTYAEDLRNMAHHLDVESGLLRVMRAELLAHCASVADEVEATAETWGGKETAAEIGKRIRALIKEGR